MRQSRMERPRRASELSSTYQSMNMDEEYSEEKVRALQRYVQRRFKRMAEDVKRERDLLGQLLDKYEDRKHGRGYESTEGESANEGGYAETTSESEVPTSERMRHSKRYPTRRPSEFDRRYSIDSLGRDVYYYDSQESYPDQSSVRSSRLPSESFPSRMEGQNKRSRRDRKPSTEEPETVHRRASFELPHHRKRSGTESDDVYSFERLHSTHDRPILEEEEPRMTGSRSFEKTLRSSPAKREIPSKPHHHHHHHLSSSKPISSHAPSSTTKTSGGQQRPRYSIDTASSRIRHLETERELVNRTSQQVPAHDAVYPLPLFYAARLGVTI